MNNFQEWKSDDGKASAKVMFDPVEKRDITVFTFTDDYVGTTRTRLLSSEEIPYLYQMTHYFMQADSV